MFFAFPLRNHETTFHVLKKNCQLFLTKFRVLKCSTFQHCFECFFRTKMSPQNQKVPGQKPRWINVRLALEKSLYIATRSSALKQSSENTTFQRSKQCNNELMCWKVGRFVAAEEQEKLVFSQWNYFFCNSFAYQFTFHAILEQRNDLLFLYKNKSVEKYYF